MEKIVFVMGATNCGKTTLIDQLSDTFHPVVVGRVLREIYPPDYFEGQAAPAKTDEIAFNIMCEGIKEAHRKGLTPLVDGQPRNQVQLEWCCRDYINKAEYECLLIHLWAPRDVRVERAKKRDSSDLAKFKLSMDRMDGDVLTLYDLWLQLQRNVLASGTHTNMMVVDTTTDDYVEQIVDFIG